MRKINQFAALKTAIAIGDKQTVEELLSAEPIVELEKFYLIELAELNGDSEIIELVKGLPVAKA